jgi:protein SCO1/2
MFLVRFPLCFRWQRLRWMASSALAPALWCAAALLSSSTANAGVPVADRTEAAPARLQGVDVTEHLGAKLPGELELVTAEGARVHLADLLPKDRPLILTFNYSNCPMLCSLQLNGLVEGLRGVDRTLGRDFELLTISLDPAEDPARLLAMKDRYITQYLAGNNASAAQVEEARRGWHFAHGNEATIKAITGRVGFSYGYNEERKEYVHPASIVFLTPSGNVARYLYGIEYHPRTLSLSVVEVSEGKVGGSMDKLILYCLHYDETEGRYAPVAMNIMRVGGSLTALTLGGVLAVFWMRESRKNKPLPIG